MMRGLLCLLLILLWASIGSYSPQTPAVTYTPQPIAFGAVKLGATSATLSSTLTNTGTDTLKFLGGSSMTGSTAFHYVTDNCSARPPGTSCVLQYQFTPKVVGPVTGANLVMTNHGAFALNFTGTGVDTVTPPPPLPVGMLLVRGLRFDSVAVPIYLGSYLLTLTDTAGVARGHLRCTATSP